MYYIKKQIEVSSAHMLNLPYNSKCRDLHGHNWQICIYCKSSTLNDCGMVEDFTIIKSKIQDVLDHKYLNDILPFNPTAENIAKWICDQIKTCYMVDVQESTGNTARYEKDK